MIEEAIAKQLKAQNAVLIAHYYVDGALQALAEKTNGKVGDSLEMARFGKNSEADTIVVAGVRFMGETAKILAPHKRVVLLDEAATCSLDEGCPIDEFSTFCNNHPERTIVVYANTSAAVKARADWMVTSSSAIAVIGHLKQQNKKILWAPDRNLGRYVRDETGADMLLWNGGCLVHEEFKAEGIKYLLENKHPNAAVLVHPESPQEVIALADVVGSTTELINAVANRSEKTFIVATDNGIFHKMREAAPDKELVEAPTMGEAADCHACAHCEWMALNTLEKCLKILEAGNSEVNVDIETSAKARIGIEKLLNFTSTLSS